MKVLLFSDPHFVDSSLAEYRWEIFNTLKAEAKKYSVMKIICLGDLTDRKNRHSADLVNRLVDELYGVVHSTGADIHILAGNHDKPLNGRYFWDFLNQINQVQYHIKPYFDFQMEALLLPYSKDPTNDWKDNETMNITKAIFMHQTAEGAMVHGRYLSHHNVPKFGVPVFSGDVHHPQTCDNIVYIGASHPVAFSDSWETRLLLVDTQDYSKYQEIPVSTIKRAIVEVASSEELERMNYSEGDQIRVRFKLSGKTLTQWPIEHQKIRQWADKKKVTIVSVESSIQGEGPKLTGDGLAQISILTPQELIEKFCKDEALSDDVLQMGLDLMKQVQ